MGAFDGEVRFRDEDFILEETTRRFVLASGDREIRVFFDGVEWLTEREQEMELLRDDTAVGMVSDIPQGLQLELEDIGKTES